jgi:hypothetical protein
MLSYSTRAGLLLLWRTLPEDECQVLPIENSTLAYKLVQPERLTMQRSATLTYWIDVIVVVLVTLLVRSVGMGHLPFDDELFHVLAAHS